MTKRARRTILQLIETSGPGGAETVFLGLCRSLDPDRWRCVAVLPPARADVVGSDWLAGQLEQSGIETVLLQESHSFDVPSFWSLLRIARVERADVFHGHLFGYCVRAALMSRLTGIPAIATLHGFSDVTPNERYLRLKFGLINSGLRRAVFVSEPLREYFVKHFPLQAALTTVVPNGLDITRFTGRDGTSFRAEYGISADEFVVGSVGNLNPMKAIDVFLHAASILKQRATEAYRFLVVGDLKGQQGVSLMQLRDALGLTEDVIFTGFRDDVSQVMSSFDIYALTSRSEGFSISVIEAMASRLPVVATRCGGPEQILDDGTTGLLVENGSAEAVAGAIETLRRSPSLRLALSSQARAAVVRNYSMEAHVRAYEHLYDSCLKRT